MLSFVGDIALNGLLARDIINNSKRFEYIKEIFARDSINFANLESPLLGIDGFNKLKDKENILFCTLDSLNVLNDLNINAVSLANNHIFDCNYSGLKNTVHFLKKNNILFTGAGIHKKDLEPIILDYNSSQVSFAAYVHKETNPRVPDQRCLVNYFSPDKIFEDLKKVQSSETKIVSIHWGKDYSTNPTPDQIEVYRKIIDKGADIIMGHHSHTIQPVEKYNNGLIIYSLGSVIFGDEFKNKKIKGRMPIHSRESIKLDILNKEVTNFYKVINNKYNFFYYEDLTDLFRYIESSALDSQVLENRFYKLVDNVQISHSKFIEYLFGYYKNPFKQLINFPSQLSKILFKYEK